MYFKQHNTKYDSCHIQMHVVLCRSVNCGSKSQLGPCLDNLSCKSTLQVVHTGMSFVFLTVLSFISSVFPLGLPIVQHCSSTPTVDEIIFGLWSTQKWLNTLINYLPTSTVKFSLCWSYKNKDQSSYSIHYRNYDMTFLTSTSRHSAVMWLLTQFYISPERQPQKQRPSWL